SDDRLATTPALDLLSVHRIRRLNRVRQPSTLQSGKVGTGATSISRRFLQRVRIDSYGVLVPERSHQAVNERRLTGRPRPVQNWDDLLTSTTTDQHRSGKTLEEVSHLRIGDKRPQRLLPKGCLSIRVVVHISGVREVVLGSRVQQFGVPVAQSQNPVSDA